MGIFEKQPFTKRAKIGKVDIELTAPNGAVRKHVEMTVSESQATGKMDGPYPDHAEVKINLDMSPEDAYELGAEIQKAAEAAGYRPVRHVNDK